MARKTTVWPKGDQWVAMFTVVSPVTQIADTAVNIASARFVGMPDVVATGNIKSVVVIRVRTRNVAMVIVEA
jgi:hypothetical protein